MRKITSDLLDIVGRLVEIDSDYRVLYNDALSRFEIHNRDVPSLLSLCFVTDELDNRVLDKARSTRKESYDALQEEIDSHNADVEGELTRRVSELGVRLEDMLSYARSASHEVIFE